MAEILTVTDLKKVYVFCKNVFHNHNIFNTET